MGPFVSVLARYAFTCAKRSWNVRTSLFLVSMLAMACHGQSLAPQSPRESTSEKPDTPYLKYQARIDPDLHYVDVRACFDGQPPQRLVALAKDVDDQLLQAAVLSGGGQSPIPWDANGMDLSGVPNNGCVMYRMELTTQPYFGAQFSQARVADIVGWLWRPSKRPPSAAQYDALTLALPKGMQASLPWTPLANGSYRVDRTTLRFRGRVAVGYFNQVRFERAGCEVHIALLRGFERSLEKVLVAHLQDAVEAAASVLGEFPVNRLQIIAVPSDAQDDAPVLFGHTTRGGGAGVLLVVNEHADLDALAHDWTAIHEFSHLLLPFVTRTDAWLSEGMATYYQEVLRARSGLLSEAEALNRLAQGATRLQKCPVPLLTKSQEMSVTHDYLAVYWGGATFALLGDIELRRRSQGRVTLDSVLRTLHTQLGFQAPPSSARKLLAAMDRIAGHPVFSELAAGLIYERPSGSLRAELDKLIDTPATFNADFGHIVVRGSDSEEQTVPGISERLGQPLHMMARHQSRP